MCRRHHLRWPRGLKGLLPKRGSTLPLCRSTRLIVRLAGYDCRSSSGRFGWASPTRCLCLDDTVLPLFELHMLCPRSLELWWRWVHLHGRRGRHWSRGRFFCIDGRGHNVSGWSCSGMRRVKLTVRARSPYRSCPSTSSASGRSRCRSTSSSVVALGAGTFSRLLVMFAHSATKVRARV